jgi:hypothetical protein
MIQATHITLRYATGKVSNLQTKELSRAQFPNLWRAADLLLHQWSYLVAGHCDDVDFTITYEDGRKYSGTIQIYAEGRREYLGDHIRNHCLLFGGRKRPAGLDDAGYQEFLKEYSKDLSFYQRMLDCYELG